MEQHLYSYLNTKYGLKQLITRDVDACLDAVRRFSAEDNDVATFGAILRNVFEPQGVYTYPVKSQGGKIQVQVNVNARAEYEQGYWKGILDAQGKSDGSYY